MSGLEETGASVRWAAVLDRGAPPAAPPRADGAASKRGLFFDPDKEPRRPVAWRKWVCLPLSWTFDWMTPAVLLGYWRPTADRHVWEVSAANRTRRAQREFMHHFYELSARQRPYVVFLASVRMIFRTMAFGGLLFLGYSATLLMQPFLLSMLINFFHDASAPLEQGFYIVAGMVAAILLGAFGLYNANIISVESGLRVRSALVASMYSKLLTVRPEELERFGSGKLTVMMQNDAQRVLESFRFINFGIYAPVQIIVIIVLLWVLAIGPYALVPVSLMCLTVVVNLVLTYIMLRLQLRLVTATDDRVKMESEVISGVRIIKKLAWEQGFIAEIQRRRNHEMSAIRLFQLFRALMLWFMLTLPSATIVITFSIYAIAGNDMTPEVVFPALLLMGLLRFPFAMLPIVVNLLIQNAVSMDRVTEFLHLPDSEPRKVSEDGAIRFVGATFRAVSDKAQKKVAGMGGSGTAARARGAGGDDVDVAEASSSESDLDERAFPYRLAAVAAYVLGGVFRWFKVLLRRPVMCLVNAFLCLPRRVGRRAKSVIEKRKAPSAPNPSSTLGPVVLRDVTFVVPRGTFCMVVGRVGSGKSSLLSGLLRELSVSVGVVELPGRVAYCSQQPWVLNATVRQNILMTEDYDEARYRAVLEATTLDKDLPNLDQGDQTMIGERGINLSGGQKQRVAIARAIYADRDTYLFDDPLSAVDVHVGKHIFENVFQWWLRGKTVILTANQLQYLPFADRVVVLDGGRIREQGRFSELMESSKLFADLIRAFGVADYEKEVAAATERALKFAEQQAAIAAAEKRAARRKRRERRLAKLAASNASPLVVAVNLDDVVGNAEGDDDEDEDDGDGGRIVDIGDDGDTEMTRLNGSGRGQESSADGVATETSRLGRVRARLHFLLGKAGTLLARRGPWLLDAVRTVFAVLFFPALWVWGSERAAHRARPFPPPAPGAPTIPDGSVSLKVWKGYITGGRSAVSRIALLFYLCVASYVLWVMTQSFLAIWLGVWSQDTAGLSQGGYLAVYDVASLVDILFAQGLATFLFAYFGVLSARSLHELLVERAIRFPVLFFDTTMLGTVLNRFIRDTMMIDLLLPGQFQFFVNYTSVIAVVFITIMVAAPWMSSAMILLMVLFLFVTLYFEKTYIAYQRMEAESRGPLISHFTETLYAAGSVRAYGLEREFRRDNRYHMNFNNRHYYALQAAAQWLAMRLDWMAAGMVGILGVMLVILRDSIDPGLAGAGLSYALQLPFSLNAFSRFRAETQNMLNHVERVMEYYKLPVEAAAHIPGSVTANWPENGRIEFRKFYLRYRPTTPYVLRNVSFVVEPRMKVGVVGRTGAGKSSLMEALFRIVEATKGQIFIDDVDIGKIGLMDLRSKLAIIPQDPTLFLGTVRSNLDPFGERSDADIWDALELCEMRPVIEKLGTPSSAHSSGLDADVAPQGLNFSVGQRQLLCMARALLRRSRILVMDEATASVDLETDLLIQRTVRTQFRDCTVITIAHRLDTVIDSDRVLVMDHGRVAEFASPRELLSKEGVFTSMVNDTGISKSASLRSMVFDKDDLPTT